MHSELATSEVDWLRCGFFRDTSKQRTLRLVDIENRLDARATARRAKRRLVSEVWRESDGSPAENTPPAVVRSFSDS